MVINYLTKSSIFLFSLIFLFNDCKSQTLRGVAYDNSSKKKVINAIIKVGDKISLTNNNGYFTISSFSSNDTLKIRALGYKNFKQVLNHVSLQDTLKLFLIQDPYQLKEVVVKADRGYLKDSIALRNTYSSVFNYKYQPLKDFIVKRDFFSKVHNFRGQSANNIITVNLLSLLNLMNSKKEPIYKLQQTLFKEEDLNYVNKRFSKEIIQKQTGLEGDSLFLFINKYKPDMAKLKGMNDYTLGIYIKNSFREFSN